MTGRILLYGHETWWRLGDSYRRAFEALGWEVEVFDVGEREEHLAPWLRPRLGRRLTRHSLMLRRLGSGDWNERLLRWASEQTPDLVFLIGGQFVMPETVEALADASSRVAVFFPDDPTPGARESRPEQIQIARQADATFIWSQQIAAILEEAGAGAVVYLPFAWDPKVHPYMEEPAGEGPEVVFVGGWDRRREQWLEPVAENFDLAIWGPGYWGERTRRGSPVRRAWRGGSLVGEEAAQALARARVSLNLLREQNLPDGTNMRTFEVPGCGGLPVADRTAGATDILPEGEAGVYFGTREEMVAVIERCLADPDSTRQTREQAHQIVASRHRYVHRASRILSAVGLA